MQSILMVVWFILVVEPLTCELRAIERVASTRNGCHIAPDLRPLCHFSGFV